MTTITRAIFSQELARIDNALKALKAAEAFTQAETTIRFCEVWQEDNGIQWMTFKSMVEKVR